MRKVWIYKRKNTKGYWIGWYEAGKRKAKALPTKTLAEHYRQIKYAQLNSEVFTGLVTVKWRQMVEDFPYNILYHCSATPLSLFFNRITNLF